MPILKVSIAPLLSEALVVGHSVRFPVPRYFVVSSGSLRDDYGLTPFQSKSESVTRPHEVLGS